MPTPADEQYRDDFARVRALYPDARLESARGYYRVVTTVANGVLQTQLGGWVRSKARAWRSAALSLPPEESQS